MDLADFSSHFRTTFPLLVGRRVLVALSGGPDSVALLHLLGDPDLDLDLEAAHVHHGVRGAEADADASFCEALCRQLDIPFHLLRIEPRPPLTSGREGTWRRLRYGALLELKTSRGFAGVATGHHRDDVAEGVLVQLLRGGGPRALAGITASTADGVIRPLLPWTRGEIRTWLEGRGISWQEDSSNLDLGLLRNRIRHEILPMLERTSTSLRCHLVHLAEALGADEDFLAAELSARAQFIDPWEPDGGVAVDTIRDLPPSLRIRWLHAQGARIGLARVTRRQTELFEELLAIGRPRAVTLGRRWRIRLAGGRLWLEPPEPPQLVPRRLILGDVVELALPGWRVRFGPVSATSTDLRWSYRPPATAKLEMRAARPEDRVEIDGVRVRASRILARALPRHLRRAWPLFCEDDRIYWIPGVWQNPEASDRESPVVEVTRS